MTLPVPVPVLAPPDLAALRSRIIAASLAGLADNSRRVYIRHLNSFLNWLSSSNSTLQRESIVAYLELHHRHSIVSYNQALSAIKRLSNQAAENLWLSWPIARSIESIPSRTLRGTPTGLWLTLEQARAMLALPSGQNLSGLRDRAVLALLLGCGLRREEAAHLSVSQLQRRDNRTMLIDVFGKGSRIRTIAVPGWADSAIREWLDAALITTGPLLRAFTPNHALKRGTMSASAIWDIVQHYSSLAGIACTPHDCRRTYSRLARQAGAPLETIQHSLGHASLVTTEKYLRTGLEANAGDYFDL